MKLRQHQQHVAGSGYSPAARITSVLLHPVVTKLTLADYEGKDNMKQPIGKYI